MTVIPLLFFAAGTRRLPLCVLGLLQYLAPVLQFAVGVGIRHEKLPPAELVGFCLVWLALIVLTVDGLRNQRCVAPTGRQRRIDFCLSPLYSDKRLIGGPDWRGPSDMCPEVACQKSRVLR